MAGATGKQQASLLKRFRYAAGAFIEALRDPGMSMLEGGGQETRRALYEYIDAWDKGTIFYADRRYRTWLTTYYRLYRHTRLLWNPITRILDAHAGFVYPGNISTDGLAFPNGSLSAVPFSDSTSTEFAQAAAQVMKWSNWQNRKSLWPRYGAMAGGALLVINDPLDARKLYLEPVKPGWVAEMQLNPAGDVMLWATEYKVKEEVTGVEFDYRKEVDREQVRTYRNDKPWSYDGVPSVLDHPYPFCPAVWVKHREGESIWGTGAIRSVAGTLGSLAEINALESQIDDAVRKGVEEITVFFAGGNVSFLNNTKRPATSEFDPADLDSDRESKRIIVAPADGRVQQLGSTMNVEAARGYLEMKKETFLSDYPEVRVWEQLREMDYAAVAAIELLHADFTTLVKEVRANYDRQMEKALQMSLTMGGILLRNVWPRTGPIDDARRKFAPFDESSFAAGDMDVEIVDRPLFPKPQLTEREKHDIADIQQNKLGLDEQYVWLTTLSIPKKDVDRMMREKEAAKTAMQDAMQQSAASTPGGVQPQPGQPQQPGQGQPAIVGAGK